MIPKKLYASDPDIPYRTTKIPPLRTKADIDGILARWGITKVAWEFDLDRGIVKLHFELPPEKFQDQTISPVVRLEPPRIWNKRSRTKAESVNWQVSMRIFHWFIKDTLAMTYAMQSQKAVAFLPHIQTSEDATVKDVVLSRLQQLKALKALPEEPTTNIPKKEVIDAEVIKD